MQIPVQISFHGVDHSDAVEERVREKVAKLEQFCDRITSCRVVIETHHHNTSNAHKTGEPFVVRVDVTLPGQEIVVGRENGKTLHTHEDVYAAINDSFSKAERLVREYHNRHKEHRSPHRAHAS